MYDSKQMETQPWQQTATQPEDQSATELSPLPGPEGVELGTGYLAVNVTTRLGLYPLAGAAVTVVSGTGPDERVWARAVTDANGQVPRFPYPPRRACGANTRRRPRNMLTAAMTCWWRRMKCLPASVGISRSLMG